MNDDNTTFPTDDAWDDEQETEIDASGIQSAAEAVREFGTTLREYKEWEERQNHYYFKAFGFLTGEYKEATLRRMEERKDN